MAEQDVIPFLDEAHEQWITNPPAPQSALRTRLYQEAVRNYLAEVGFTRASIRLDTVVPAVFDKQYDLIYSPFDIPRLAVSFKIIPLHELSAHARSRLEEATGDAANVHMQFPDLVLGYLWVLAIDPTKHVAEADWKNLRQALAYLTRLTGRPSIDSPIGRYEGVGIYLCRWGSDPLTENQVKIFQRVKGQIPQLLTPNSMMGLLLANYRLRFGELHEPT